MKEQIEGWVARDGDNNGFLTCFNTIPIRMPKRFLRKQRKVWLCSKECTSWVGVPRNLFPNLKWEDEPIKVKITYETIEKV